jgi:hypothetical protein
MFLTVDLSIEAEGRTLVRSLDLEVAFQPTQVTLAGPFDRLMQFHIKNVDYCEETQKYTFELESKSKDCKDIATLGLFGFRFKPTDEP